MVIENIQFDVVDGVEVTKFEVYFENHEENLKVFAGYDRIDGRYEDAEELLKAYRKLI